MGLMAALDAYPADARDKKILEGLHTGLSALPEIDVSVENDRAGRAIQRIGIRSQTMDLGALADHLRDGNPSIRTRNHQLSDGLMLLDPRELTMDHVAVIIARVAEFLNG